MLVGSSNRKSALGCKTRRLSRKERAWLRDLSNGWAWEVQDLGIAPMYVRIAISQRSEGLL